MTSSKKRILSFIITFLIAIIIGLALQLQKQDNPEIFNFNNSERSEENIDDYQNENEIKEMVLTPEEQELKDRYGYGREDYKPEKLIKKQLVNHLMSRNGKHYTERTLIDGQIGIISKEMNPELPVFSISGTVTSGATSVTAIAFNTSGEKYNDYTLQKFSTGDRTWKYNVNPNFDNIILGENNYIVVAEFSNGEYSYETIKVNYTNEKEYYKHLSTPQKFCLMDVCNDPKVGFKLSGDVFIQEGYPGTAKYYKIEYIPGEYIKKLTLGDYADSAITILKKGEYFIKQVENFGGCGGPGGTSQEVFDAKENPVTVSELKMPTELMIGNLKFTSPTSSFSKIGDIHELNNIEVEDIIQERTDYDDKNIKIKYIKQFLYVKNNFNIPVMYKLDSDIATSEEFSFQSHFYNGFVLVPKIDSTLTEIQPYSLMNYKVTKEIMDKYLKINMTMVDKDGNQLIEYDNELDKHVNKLQSNRLPLYNYFPVNDKYDMLFTTRGHKVFTMAEMCKPAIYVYDKQNRTHEVDINFKTEGRFTHLEPKLNTTMGRKYNSKDGKVLVNGEQFDYLYYAAAVTKYGFNQDGRIVKGELVSKFFDQKLDEIGFKSNEKVDFLDYRLKKFETGSHYRISFKYNEEIDQYVDLQHSTQPNTEGRVLMEAIEIINPSILKEVDIQPIGNPQIQKLKRDPSFDIFERGGIFVERDGSLTIR